MAEFEIVIPTYLEEYFDSLVKEHGIALTMPQKRWYTMKHNELGEKIRQEYPSTYLESFMGSSEGFWYLKEMNEIKQNGQVTKVPFQPELLVQTAWDLGFRDSTAIWFFQVLPSGVIHVINYYENSGEGLSHYVGYINSLPYRDKISVHHLPHDAAAHDLSSGLSVARQAEELGLNVNVLDRYNSRASRSKFILEVQRVRNILSRTYFDEEKCTIGTKCLEGYRKKWNEQMVCYIDEPIHDWASHGADAFRALAQATEMDSRRPDKSRMRLERQKINKARSMRI